MEDYFDPEDDDFVSGNNKMLKDIHNSEEYNTDVNNEDNRKSIIFMIVIIIIIFMIVISKNLKGGNLNKKKI